ncbi:hypothetical protein D3C73_1399810 [compost metagenome]
MPKTISMVATIHILRSTDSIWSWNNRPRTMIGRLPRMTSQPMRASGLLRSTLPVREPNQAPTIRTMSRQK